MALRDYLMFEFNEKFKNAPPLEFNNDQMHVANLQLPKQNNYTDCGVFMLHYVEKFFKDPIKDFRFPLKSMLSWFHQDEVTKKREEISNVLKTLIPDGVAVPEIEFPTKDGKILDQPEDLEVNNNALKSQPAGKTKRASKRSLDKNEPSSSKSSAKKPKQN